jgi:hypothetical protein
VFICVKCVIHPILRHVFYYPCVTSNVRAHNQRSACVRIRVRNVRRERVGAYTYVLSTRSACMYIYAWVTWCCTYSAGRFTGITIGVLEENLQRVDENMLGPTILIHPRNSSETTTDK